MVILPSRSIMWTEQKSPPSMLVQSYHHITASCDLIPLMWQTKDVGIWSDRGTYNSYTAPRTKPQPERVLELILGLMQYQDPPQAIQKYRFIQQHIWKISVSVISPNIGNGIVLLFSSVTSGASLRFEHHGCKF